MYDVAIIGGMGPEATAALFSRLVRRTQAARDQEHMTICVFNDARIPDRTAYLLGDGEDPLPRILENIHRAKAAGCKRFVVPCNTAHAFAKDYAAVKGIDFINMIEETCKALKHNHPGQPAVVLATHGTVRTQVYGHAGEALGVDIRYPGPKAQDRVMAMIHAIKGGAYDEEQLAQELLSLLEADNPPQNPVYVLACTELSLLTPALRRLRPGLFVDAMDVLCERTITACGYRVKDEHP